jgi:hypothetical protein
MTICRSDSPGVSVHFAPSTGEAGRASQRVAGSDVERPSPEYWRSQRRTDQHKSQLGKDLEKLPGQDSNLERGNQNPLCYHYTTG